MDTLRLAEHVDGIFYSARLGAKKPDVEFFNKVRNEVETTPRDSTHRRQPLEFRGCGKGGLACVSWDQGQFADHPAQLVYLSWRQTFTSRGDSNSIAPRDLESSKAAPFPAIYAASVINQLRKSSSAASHSIQ